MRSHKCPVRSCTAMVIPSRLMCPTHWYLVPNDLATAVYREYRAAPRSEAHFAAMQDAVDFVNAISPSQIITPKS